jgi:hypothetical protein
VRGKGKLWDKPICERLIISIDSMETNPRNSPVLWGEHHGIEQRNPTNFVKEGT